MQLIRELFFTAVIIFVLFKLFGRNKKSGNVFFTQNNFTQKKNNGSTNTDEINQNSSSAKNKSDDEGEYIDYEEIK
ncbi:MAG: DUF4834 family protein, partial [Bacteroidota bacterium]|jgi:predicted RecA/RadA family phage recombinase